MTLAAYWFRASLRRRWRGLAGIVVLLGLIGGLSLFALAGARRTQSAYPRFLRSTNPSTMAVVVGDLAGGGREALELNARLPEVVQAKAYFAFNVAPWVDGQPDLEQIFETLGSVDGRYFDQDVYTPTEGRRPDPSRADEVAVNEESARRYGYHVGQRVDFGVVSDDDLQDPALEANLQPRLLISATIVGVGAFIEEVLQDDTDRSPLALFTPAFVEEAKGLETYSWQGLILRNGEADVAPVKQAIFARGGTGFFHETSIDVFHAQQAVRPISLALAAFGAIAGLAGLVLVGQAIGRHVRFEREEAAVARSVGAAPGTITMASVAAPAAAVVAGAVLAIVLAVIASPVMPIGSVGRVEIDPGIDVDWTVLGLGGLVMVVVLVALTTFAAWRNNPHRVAQRSASRKPSRPGLLARTSGLPVPGQTGLRMALEPGQGATAVPVRSVIAGAVIAVAALVAAVTFGASLHRLVTHPRLFGWDWNVALVDGGGYGNVNAEAADEVLGSDPDIAAHAGAYYGNDELDGLNVPLLAMEPGSAATPPLREGRMVERAGEIVLGPASLAQLHKKIGDTVMSSTGPRHIVGSATFPSIGQVHSNHTSLGVGGIVVYTDLPGYGTDITGGENLGPNVLFVRFRDGADEAAVIERLNGLVEEFADYNDIVVTPVQRSAEIANADDISGSSTLLGVAVALSALASLTIALTAAVRRRRREFALLKALGFTRRQLSATVAWQATSMTVVGLVVGVPLGVVLGRVLWNQFAEQLDVLAEPALPIGAIGIVVLAALVAANIVAAIPTALCPQRSVRGCAAFRVTVSSSARRCDSASAHDPSAPGGPLHRHGVRRRSDVKNPRGRRFFRSPLWTVHDLSGRRSRQELTWPEYWCEWRQVLS